MNEATKQAKLITGELLLTGEILLRGLRELARDDVLSRVYFNELACQIFNDSAFDSFQEELSPGEILFSPEIDRYITQAREVIAGIDEDIEKAFSSREGIEKLRIAQEYARRCIPLLERWLALNS